MFTSGKFLKFVRTELSDDYVITLKMESKSFLRGFGYLIFVSKIGNLKRFLIKLGNQIFYLRLQAQLEIHC